MRLDKHPILMQGHELMQAIEECGASVELTAAVIKAGELLEEVDKLVDILLTSKFKIGDLVRPKDEKQILISGCNQYQSAVVISLSPFILTSLDSDMRWAMTIVPNDFEIIGTVDKKILDHCKRRILF